MLGIDGVNFLFLRKLQHEMYTPFTRRRYAVKHNLISD